MKHLSTYIDTVLKKQKEQYQVKKQISECIQKSINITIDPEQIEIDGSVVKCIVSSVCRVYIFENQIQILKEFRQQNLPYKI